MKVQLDENTFNAYLNEAIRQEISEKQILREGEDIYKGYVCFRVDFDLMGRPLNKEEEQENDGDASYLDTIRGWGKDLLDWTKETVSSLNNPYAKAKEQLITGEFGSNEPYTKTVRKNLGIEAPSWFRNDKASRKQHDKETREQLITALKKLGYSDLQIGFALANGKTIEVGHYYGGEFSPLPIKEQKKEIEKVIGQIPAGTNLIRAAYRNWTPENEEKLLRSTEPEEGEEEPALPEPEEGEEELTPPAPEPEGEEGQPAPAPTPGPDENGGQPAPPTPTPPAPEQEGSTEPIGDDVFPWDNYPLDEFPWDGYKIRPTIRKSKPARPQIKPVPKINNPLTGIQAVTQTQTKPEITDKPEPTARQQAQQRMIQAAEQPSSKESGVLSTKDQQQALNQRKKAVNQTYKDTKKQFEPGSQDREILKNTKDILTR